MIFFKLLLLNSTQTYSREHLATDLPPSTQVNNTFQGLGKQTSARFDCFQKKRVQLQLCRYKSVLLRYNHLQFKIKFVENVQQTIYFDRCVSGASTVHKCCRVSWNSREVSVFHHNLQF